MLEPEARSLKPGDRLIYRIEDVELAQGAVKKLHWAAFTILWDDGVEQVVSYNEAHYIERA